MTVYMQRFSAAALAAAALCCSAAAASSQNLAATEQLYEYMLSEKPPKTALLNLFFTKMPKGGDIHHHYPGALYAETFLVWIAKKGWFIDSCALTIVKDKELATAECPPLTIVELLNNNEAYRRLLSLWSNKDFYNHSHDTPPPDVNFFNSFNYFLEVSLVYMKEGLNIIKQRAIKENVSYVETMLRTVRAQSSDYFDNALAKKYNNLLIEGKTAAKIDEALEEITNKLVNDKNFNNSVADFVALVAESHADIDDRNFIMRYQTYAIRVLDPLQVFVDLFSGYLAAKKSRLIVGVNIVAPENNHVALRDYTLHMRMFGYLKDRYPDVNRALHAGELTLGMVRPEDLTFHIRQALDIAGAQRIGHGVDLPYEDGSLELLKDLKAGAVIEINLSSNEFILGVKDNEHPYLIYSAFGVPMVISSDDTGVSRNNLSHEYVLLASRYKPSYKQMKKYVFNSIEYSFLSPKDKKRTTRQLRKRFSKFEAEMTSFYDKIASGSE